MTFDLQRIRDSKQAYRRRLAARPIAEKLRLLDELRERALSLRDAKLSASEAAGVLREKPAPYGASPPRPPPPNP